MLNNCFNTLILESDSIQTLQTFYKDNYKDHKQEISFDKLIPVKIEHDNKANRSECCEMWGTKMDASFVRAYYENDERLIYTFSTDCYPPISWLHDIAQQYPTICFMIEYSESKKDLWGKQTYVEGLMIDEELESLGSHNWRLCDKNLLHQIIDNDINAHILTKENYPLRIANIVDDYAFESQKYCENIDVYVEKLVEQRLGLT